MQRTQPEPDPVRMMRLMEEWTRSNWEQVNASRELTKTLREFAEQLAPLAKHLAKAGGLSALAGFFRPR